jgi:hypothetical protein
MLASLGRGLGGYTSYRSQTRTWWVPLVVDGRARWLPLVVDGGLGGYLSSLMEGSVVASRSC